MRTRPLVQLSRLRQIGWDFWDPIGIREIGDDWKGGAADEYDTYLLRIASMLNDAASEEEEEATAYLVEIAENHMGLGRRPEHIPAAARTVGAIKAYLDELARTD